MEYILKQVASPDFWFQIVTMGIVMSVVGNYANKSFSKIMSRLSTTYKKFSDKQAEKWINRVMVFLAHPQLLVYEYFRLILDFGASVLLITIANLLPVWLVLRSKFPSIEILHMYIGYPTPGETVIHVASGVVAFWGLYCWNVGLRRWRFCNAVRVEMERRCTENLVHNKLRQK